MDSTQLLPQKDVSFSSIQVVKLALLFEIPLCCPFLIKCAILNDWSSFTPPTLGHVFLGVVASLILFILNAFFYSIIYRFKLSNMTSFIEGVVEPLAASLSVRSALVVSLAAGIGEELFFRGFLLPYIGLLGSSILFSLTHFFFEIRKYFVLCIVYTAIGAIFGLLFQDTGSLWVVVIFHALYDFMALLFFKSRLRFKLRTCS